MSKDAEFKITVNADGVFKLVGDNVGEMDLINATAGLIKATAERLGKTEVRVLINLLMVAGEESELMTACDELIKSTAHCLRKSKIDLLKQMLIDAGGESELK